MDEAGLRALAARTEDHRLDFKRDLYSSNEELAKDLMAIANLLAPGQTGYILLGVKQRPDDTGDIVGVALGAERDSHYQQKVAGRLNRSPRFTFLPFQLSEGEVGVFEIAGVGERPYFPIVTAGNLKKFIPQKRLGSSTADASPDEVREWVREDSPSADTALQLERIPETERANVLLVADMLNETYSVLRVAPFSATLLAIDQGGRAARFRLNEHGRELSIPVAALGGGAWKDGIHWRVVVDGYLRGTQNGTIWEYQPRSRAQR